MAGQTDEFATVRRLWEGMQKPRRRKWNLPGFDGRVVIEAGPTDWPTTLAFTLALQDGDPGLQPKAAAEYLVAATTDIIVEGESFGDWYPVDGEPSRFTALLGVLTLDPVESVRGIVARVSESAMVELAAEVNLWAQEVGKEAAEAVPGE